MRTTNNFLHSYFTSNDVNISSSTGSYVEKHFRSKSVKNKVGRGIGRDPFLGTPTIRDSYGANGNWRINNTFNLTGWVGYSLARAQGHDSSGVSRRGFGADYWSWMTALSAVDFFKDGAVLYIEASVKNKPSNCVSSKLSNHCFWVNSIFF